MFQINQKSVPRVSIGLPVRNGEAFLAEALDSLVSQTFENIEIIVSDNGSTDATADICNEFAEDDSRIQYVRSEENAGASANFNKTFLLSRGEYFKWAAHDDVCHPDFIRRCVDELDASPGAVLAYPWVKIIDEDSRVISMHNGSIRDGDRRPEVRFRDLISVEHSCYAVFGLMRSATLRRTGLIGSYVSSDRVLLAELGLFGRLQQIPEYLFYRRDHATTSLRQAPGYRARAAWFDPKNGGGAILPTWKLGLEYVRAIGRTGLPPRKKVRCLEEISRWAFTKRRMLARQMYHAARDQLRTVVHQDS